MTRRPRGTGTIEQTPRGFVARLPGRGSRLPPFATRGEAERALAAATARVRGGLVEGDRRFSLAAFGETVIDQRERSGFRDTGTERSRWRTHVAEMPLGRTPILEVSQGDVARWRDDLVQRRPVAPPGHRARRGTIARSSAKNALNLLRTVLGAALERGIIGSDPSAGVRLPRQQGVVREPWTFLRPEEQAAVLAALEEPERALVEVAMRSGIRASELAWMRVEDVELERVPPRLVIRRSRRGGPTKNGKIRFVPLTPEGAGAVRRWMAQRPSSPLAFPGANGERRQVGHLLGSRIIAGKRVDRWAAVTERVLGRHVRWHDLRHTCGSSLVAGWWGPPWRLEEVRAYLGHGSIAMTERYAHLAESVLDRAVTTRHLPAAPEPVITDRAEKQGSHLRDLNSRPTVYETAVVHLKDRGDASVLGVVAGSLADMAQRALEAVGRQEAGGVRQLIELAEAVLAQARVAEERSA